MNIVEEYAQRASINYPVAFHVSSPSLLILRSNKTFWDSKWCVLSVSWEANPHHLGSYRVRLSSPASCRGNQDLFCLSNSHFTLEKSWLDYEKFFYQWNPVDEGLSAVFGKEAFLAAWEIFICIHDKWFLNQTFSRKDELYSTVDPTTCIEERVSCCESFIGSSHFSCLLDRWNRFFLDPLEKRYLNWFNAFLFGNKYGYKKFR